MQLRVTAWGDGDLEQGHEDVLQHLLEVGQLLFGVVDITWKTEITFYYNILATWQLQILQIMYKSQNVFLLIKQVQKIK